MSFRAAQRALRGIRRGRELLCLGVWPGGSQVRKLKRKYAPPVAVFGPPLCHSIEWAITMRNHDTYTPAYRAAAELSQRAYQTVVCGSEDAQLTAQAAAAYTALEE